MVNPYRCPKQSDCDHYRNPYGFTSKEYICVYRDYDKVKGIKRFKCIFQGTKVGPTSD